MKNVLLTFLAFASCSVFAAPSHCPEQYVGGVAPDIQNQKMAHGFRELCSTGFSVGYSPLVRTPLWSAEHITAEHVKEQKGLERENTFHPDDRLSHNERAELADFIRSGYDRGHMVPSASAWNPQVQNETFALSNMVPQSPENNRGLHAHIEMAVRAWAQKNGDLYVITGPLYRGDSIQWLNSRVAIPTHIFKLVYDPRSKMAAAYLEENKPGESYKEISLAQLNELAGINFLPGVSIAGQLKLAAPLGSGVIGADGAGRSSHGSTGAEIYTATKIAKHLMRF